MRRTDIDMWGGLPVLIGLSGKMGAGKTYLAEFLANEHQYCVRSFASALKQDIYDLGLPWEDVYVKKPPYIRQLLQMYGAAQRNQDPDYWIKRLRCVNDQGLVVIDDVRFPNELEFIQKKGGVVIRVVNLDRQDTGDDPSETALDNYTHDFDAVISAGQGDLKSLTASMDVTLNILSGRG